jgi:hypothetical protein
VSIWWAFPPLTTIPWSYRKGRNLLRICCEMGVLSIYESGAYALSNRKPERDFVIRTPVRKRRELKRRRAKGAE